MSKDTAAVKAYKVSCLVEPDGTIKRNVYLVVKGNKVLEKTFRRPEALKVKEIKGTLYPPFVNAHTHLELSALSFSPDKFASFFDWLLWIISKRQTFTEDWIENSFQRGLKLLESTGTYYIGDISSFGYSKKCPVKKFHLVSFLEIIGKEKDLKELQPPLSAHSVYSVSFELLKEIAVDSLERNYPFQIHLGEVVDEQLLVSGKSNRFESLIYPEIGRKKYPMPESENLIDYLRKADALHENTIAVHCTNLSEKEIEMLIKHNASIVLCPRSNLHLKVGFPNVEPFIGYEKIALGTDGMSTNLSLNVLEELKTLYYRLDCKVSLKKLFYTVTLGGANTLRIENYRVSPIFSYTPQTPENPLDFLLTLPSLKIITL